MEVTIELTEEMLGTASANKDLYEEFIASKRPDGVDGEELDTLPEVSEELEKSTTVFHREDGKPIIYDYQIKGFFKDACGCLRRVKSTKSAKLKAYKKVIDGLVFIDQRTIKLDVDEVGICERPLRAQTAQGERVALARSETVPAGTTFDLTINLLDESLESTVIEWLDYGKLRGLGQWRNSGKGRFSYEVKS